MTMPHLSTLTAISELFVTAGVFYVVLTNLKGAPFRWPLAGLLVLFEFSVNMLYMIYRMQHPSHVELADGVKIFAALHGSLSLIVFVLFATYSCLAYLEYKKGRAFFRDRPRLTWIFLGLWTVSVASGERSCIYCRSKA